MMYVEFSSINNVPCINRKSFVPFFLCFSLPRPVVVPLLGARSRRSSRSSRSWPDLHHQNRPFRFFFLLIIIILSFTSCLVVEYIADSGHHASFFGGHTKQLKHHPAQMCVASTDIVIIAGVLATIPNLNEKSGPPSRSLS